MWTCLRRRFDAVYCGLDWWHACHCVSLHCPETTNASYCNGHVNAVADSRFNLSYSDGRIRVRRYRGDRNLVACNVKQHSGQTPILMAWGIIGYNMRSRLLRIEGNLNSNRCIREVDARPHVGRNAQAFFNEGRLPLIPWPARSPDMSPVENVWDMHIPTSCGTVHAQIMISTSFVSRLRNDITSRASSASTIKMGMPAARCSIAMQTRGASRRHATKTRAFFLAAPLSEFGRGQIVVIRVAGWSFLRFAAEVWACRVAQRSISTSSFELLKKDTKKENDSNPLLWTAHISKYGLHTCSNVTKLPALKQAVGSDVTGAGNLTRLADWPVACDERLLVPRSAARMSAPMINLPGAHHTSWAELVESHYVKTLRESMPVLMLSNWCSPPRTALKKLTRFHTLDSLPWLPLPRPDPQLLSPMTSRRLCPRVPSWLSTLFSPPPCVRVDMYMYEVRGSMTVDRLSSQNDRLSPGKPVSISSAILDIDGLDLDLYNSGGSIDQTTMTPVAKLGLQLLVTADVDEQNSVSTKLVKLLTWPMAYDS
ncbi:hypothetical protein PR048_024929 [Dryococelus australis]|uniref:Uncharacterized protein n=1 Tax=Dryococelus australis TaxID=614101 RepID=A0ABQ9GQ24_9NEOP|nr:hypothetical protein PR048_024929 [Dryococelus australis]